VVQLIFISQNSTLQTLFNHIKIKRMHIKTSLVTLFFLISVLIFPDQSIAATYTDCGNNQKSRSLAKMIIHDKRQNRTTLNCNSKLTEIALKKAKEMAMLGRVSHVGLQAANRRLIDEGYPLSKIYPRQLENNVEAIAGGIFEAAEMWSGFKSSDSHRMHLLAEHEFYLLQNEIGVAYYSDLQAPHIQYWVVYVAHQQELKTYTGAIAKSKD